MSFTGKVPIRDPLGLQNGIITNPQWIKWLTEQLAPAIVAFSNAGLSPDSLLLYRQASGVSQAQDSADTALIAARAARGSYPPDVMPVSLRHFQQLSGDQNPIPVTGIQRTAPVWLLSDTHANRAKYPAGSFAPETGFFETDRRAFYRSSGTNWVYAAGICIDTAANRPADLGTNDSGFVFLATDSLVFEWWDGASWNIVYPTGAAAGSYGDATHVAALTVDANKRITAIASTLITGVTPGGAAGGDLAGTYPNPSLKNTGPGAGTHTVGARLTALGTDGAITIDAQGRVTAITDAT